MENNSERDYTEEYGKLLKKTIRGIRLRGFFLGYTSEILSEYIREQKDKIYDIRNDAYVSRVEINGGKNWALSSNLFGLEADVLRENLNFAFLFRKKNS